MDNRTRVLWAEKAEFLQGWGIKGHTHEYYHLFYILEGEGAFCINGEAYDAKPGVGFFCAPDTLHELKKVEDKLIAYEIKFIILDEQLKSRMKLQDLMFEGNLFFDTTIAYIVKNGRSRIPLYIQNTDDFLCTLLVHLSDNGALPEALNSELIDTEGFSEATVKIVNYIERNYANHIYLDEIAEYIDYNRNYMCSLFKKDTGITVIDYLNYVRIRKACEYISYSDVDISQVCYRVGFTNVSHFNRTFKKFVGMPPGTFHKLYPLDISENQENGENATSGISDQIMTISEALGTLFNPRKA